MLKKLILSAGALVVFGSGFFVARELQRLHEVAIESSAAQISPVVLETVTRPWIEVLASPVQEFRVDGTIERELQTGDELMVGSGVETGYNAVAVIYFPDGSAARLERNTKITVEAAEYDHASEKLSVRLTLLAGQVWSKIISLATPDSEWEVKTSNTVATVRGTAFGMSFAQGASRVLGSHNTVRVAVLDPETRRAIQETEKNVTSRELFEIKQESVSTIQKNPSLAVIKIAPVGMLGDGFVKRNQELDTSVDARINKLEGEGRSLEEARKEFRKENFEQFKDKIQERRVAQEAQRILKQQPVSPQKERILEKIQQLLPKSLAPILMSEPAIIEKTKAPVLQTSPLPTSLVWHTTTQKIVAPTSTLPLNAPTLSTTTQTLSTPSLGTMGGLGPIGLLIVLNGTMSAQISEGETLTFRAYLMMSDGRKTDVTNSVKWEIAGKIGTIKNAGVFLAELAPDIAESGEAYGAVMATWIDAETGKAFLGKSSIFKVQASVEAQTITEGQ